jgi:hypothetical protein
MRSQKEKKHSVIYITCLITWPKNFSKKRGLGACVTINLVVYSLVGPALVEKLVLARDKF